MKKVCILIFTLLICVRTQEAPLKKNFTLIVKEKESEFTPVNLQKYIIEKKLKHPHIVYAQALLETGEFKSTIFKENNNLFGMKYVGDFRFKYGRPTTAIGSRYGHAVYTHWKKSVDDYLLWQQMFKKTPTDKEDEYFTLLRAKYAEDRRYVKVLKGIIKSDTINWNGSNTTTQETQGTIP